MRYSIAVSVTDGAIHADPAATRVELDRASPQHRVRMPAGPAQQRAQPASSSSVAKGLAR